jgi:methylated-DNA-[protein]-cysteine S-methyltransferase
MTPALNQCDVAVFATRLGWMAFVAQKNHLKQLVFGHPTRKSAFAALDRRLLVSARSLNDSSLIKRLQAYAEGKKDDFRDVAVESHELTAFQRKVQKICREIPFGKIMTYGELAARAGSPGAARAVGSCMAKNRVPLIVPCHRVVAAGNRTGNFSAPGGIAMKRRLLDMERHADLVYSTR